MDHHHPAPTDRPDCPTCASARSNPRQGLYDMTCLGCVARHLACSPDAWAAIRHGDTRALVDRIRERWGERFADGRRAVWAWLQLMTPS